MNSDVFKFCKDKKTLVILEELLKYDMEHKNCNVINRLFINSNFKKYFNEIISKWKCIWFNEKEEAISNKLPFYDVIYDENNKVFFNDIKHYKSNTNNFNKFKIIKKTIDNIKEKNKLTDKLNFEIKKLMDENVNETSIKCKITKGTKKINNYGKTIKAFTYEIFPNIKQTKILHEWFDECDIVYNYCIKLNEQKKEKNEYFNLDYKKSKLEVFNDLYEDKKKPAPYDILTDEVRSFCSNVESCKSNLKNGNIKFFKFKPKNRYCGRSILIPKKSINEDGFFSSLLNEPIKGFENINTKLIQCDCRLVFDKYLNKYFIKCPMYIDIKDVADRKETVALDPGEKIFMSYYSFNDCGMIGYDIRNKILKYQIKIKKLQSKIKKNKNRKNKKIKNKSRLIRRFKNYYLKIKNLVKELHNKTALYLVKNYKQILLPKFETSNMISKTSIKNKIKNIKILPKENQKMEYRKLTKKVNLCKSVKFVLNSLSHYKFKQHLLNKGKEYGCDVKIVTEEYTSQCCSKCGFLSNKYVDRTKKCPYCNLKINRDINGSRNILIKNWHGNYK